MKYTDKELRTIGKKIVEKYPWLIEDVLKKPVLSDLALIPSLFDDFVTAYPIDIEKMRKRGLMTFRGKFVCVIILLFDPIYLTGENQLIKYGIRSKLSELIPVDPARITHTLKSVAEKYRNNQKYRNEVNYICDQIKEHSSIFF